MPMQRSTTPSRTGRIGRLLMAALFAVLLLLSSACTSSTNATADQPGAVGKEDLQLILVIRTYTSPYEAELVTGAQAYADHIGIPLKVVTTDGDSQKQLSLVKAALTGDKKSIVSINVNQSSDTPAIVNAVAQAGGYITTLWNKHDEVKVWDYPPNWVSHIAFDGRVDGYDTAKGLMDEIGSGGVVAIQGILDNLPGAQRYEGFQKALSESPGITMLDQQVGDWDRGKAYQVAQTLLTKYGEQIKGIWVADDQMALGALKAVQEAGRNDIVITGDDGIADAFTSIEDGTMLNTYAMDQYYTGAVGLALGYEAATGALDVNALDHSQRQFYAAGELVDAANVTPYLTPPDLDALMAELDEDPFARLGSGIE